MSGSPPAACRPGLDSPPGLRAESGRPGLVRHWALSLTAGLTIGGFLAGASWLAFSEGPVRAPEQVLVTIPADTAERIAAGTATSAIPADLQLVAGDTLVLRNEDAVSHRIGGYTVAPGATLSVPLATAGGGTFRGGTFLCTFHPRGSIGLDVRDRAEPWSILPAVILLGLPIGIVVGAVGWVMRGLDAADGAGGA